MRYIITKNGAFVNAIEGSEAFVAAYCEKNGYAFEAAPLPEPPAPEPEPEEPPAEADMMKLLLEQEYRLTMLELAAGAAER